MKEQRFEKIVEYGGFKWDKLSICMIIGLVILTYILCIYFTILVPEWGTNFFPIGSIVLGNLIVVVVSIILSRNKKVYWGKIK